MWISTKSYIFQRFRMVNIKIYVQPIWTTSICFSKCESLRICSKPCMMIRVLLIKIISFNQYTTITTLINENDSESVEGNISVMD